MAALSTRLRSLEKRVSELPKSDSIIVPILTFDPAPFEVLQEIKVVVRSADGDYVATFFDANISAVGCNATDAVDELKQMLLRRFKYLDKTPAKKLGPALVKQIAVLRSFVRRRA